MIYWRSWNSMLKTEKVKKKKWQLFPLQYLCPITASCTPFASFPAFSGYAPHIYILYLHPAPPLLIFLPSLVMPPILLGYLAMQLSPIPLVKQMPPIPISWIWPTIENPLLICFLSCWAQWLFTVQFEITITVSWNKNVWTAEKKF